MSKEALLIFTKNPEPGKVKTRLAAALGNEEALSIYRQLLLHTASVTCSLPVDKFVCYCSHVEKEDLWCDQQYYKQLQEGNDLGERMTHAFASMVKRGYGKIVIIGTDCPELNAATIMNAFDYLATNDVVIGPAADGGYYLLAMKQLHSHLFENMNWSTQSVLADTLKKCDACHLAYHLLPVLSDIDEAKDWEAFQTLSQ